MCLRADRRNFECFFGDYFAMLMFDLHSLSSGQSPASLALCKHIICGEKRNVMERRRFCGSAVTVSTALSARASSFQAEIVDAWKEGYSLIKDCTGFRVDNVGVGRCACALLMYLYPEQGRHVDRNVHVDLIAVHCCLSPSLFYYVLF